MTSAEEDRTDDDPGAEREPDASRESGAAPSSTGGPSHRREFLAKLIAMTFLTAGVVRTGGAQQTGQGGLGDGTCGVLLSGAIAEDDDCGSPTDAVDNDCGLPRPASAGGGTFTDNDCTGPGTGPSKDNDCGKATGEGTGTHSDEDCSPTNPNRSDSDCGGLTGDGAARHSDSHCSPTHVDFDCGYSSNSGATQANGDLCCNANANNSVDEACGMTTGSGGSAEEDNYCSQLNNSEKDFDCGRGGMIGQSDSDCGTTSQDNDCPPHDSDGCFSEDIDPEDSLPLPPRT